ncbi:ssDNA endonuclease and repair protein rad10 [Apiotrichum porosum]|uniref:SsDNA endonuclease and repair protein rad10 n=1 Tax=Apiotrichum porosum TaxID=105984 RepID=A0A427Y4C1_9TREE|nr:ssDNA endonuclease and repair protein rad10 [Apiotrichum porosum]RSH85940.1 ssDNA endonuclease and repair protein rad10 [Apiotrichum porosum]
MSDTPQQRPLSTAPGFQPASSLPRSTHAPSLSSNRNAGGGQRLPPKTGESSSTVAAAPGGGPSAPAPPSGPSKPVNRPAASKNAIVHSVLQRRNPILPLIRNVGLEIGDIKADYQVGAHNGVLFLSLKYHRLHPEYIHTRIEKIQNVYKLRILLILCDINEHQQPLRELSKLAIINELTILVAFSNEEAAQYLTTLKAYEHKSADSLKERVRQTYQEQLEHVLTSGRKVNKANAETLSATFGSFASMVKQPNQALNNVKGIGATKTLSLYRAFNEPFIAGAGPKPPTVASSKQKGTAATTTPKDDGERDGPETTMSGEPAKSIGASLELGEKTSNDNEDSPPFRRQPSTPPTPKRPDDRRLPSRSPSAERTPPPDAVWHDPLDDDEDDDDDIEQPVAKKARV